MLKGDTWKTKHNERWRCGESNPGPDKPSINMIHKFMQSRYV